MKVDKRKILGVYGAPLLLLPVSSFCFSLLLYKQLGHAQETIKQSSLSFVGKLEGKRKNPRILTTSSFEFLFIFITVQIAMTRTGKNKTIFLIVRWETRGKKKKSSGWKWIFTTSAFPFKFRDLCCINYCKICTEIFSLK